MGFILVQTRPALPEGGGKPHTVASATHAQPTIAHTRVSSLTFTARFERLRRRQLQRKSGPLGTFGCNKFHPQRGARAKSDHAAEVHKEKHMPPARVQRNLHIGAWGGGLPEGPAGSECSGRGRGLATSSRPVVSQPDAFHVQRRKMAFKLAFNCLVSL